MSKLHRKSLPALLLAGSCLATAAAAAPNPARTPAPSGVEGRALGVGAKAPVFSLPSTAGGRWELGSALAKGRVVLLFYRGDW